MNRLRTAIIVLVLFFVSCKTPSSVSKTPLSTPLPKTFSSRAIMDSMQSHAFHFDWFSGKAKVEVTHGTDVTNFTASFRIRNDSIIWISISPAFGIEVARVLLTKDSIRVIDRLSKSYSAKDYNFFSKYTSLPVDLLTIQDLIEGNPLLANQQSFEVTENDSSYLLNYGDQDLTNSITLNRQFRNLIQNIKDGTTGSVSIMMNQYDIQYNPPFALWRKIQLVHPDVTEIVITFSKVKINEPENLPFNIKEQ